MRDTPNHSIDRRPSTFTDWRKLYKNNLLNIGFYVAWLAERGHIGPHKEIHVDRQLHCLLQRQRRLQARMDVEHEAHDDSYTQEMWKIVFGTDTRDMRYEP